MKTSSHSAKILIGCALGLASVTGTLAADAGTLTARSETNSVTPPALGFYVEEGISNQITKVLSATPAYVVVLFTGENGLASRKIPRNELPPELAIKYPYDAEKAAAYKVELATNAAQQQVAQQAAQQNAALRQTALINVKIAQLVFQDKELQKEVNLYTRMPWGNGRKVHLAHLLDQQQSIREQVIQFRRQLVALR